MAIRTRPSDRLPPRAGRTGHRTAGPLTGAHRKTSHAVRIGTRTAHPVKVPRTGPVLPAPIRLFQLTILASVLAAGTAACIVLAAVTYLGFLSTTVDVPPAGGLAETT